MKKTHSTEQHPQFTTPILWLITITTGLVVANIYYSQPLLGDIARSFHVSNAAAGRVSMFTQMGYASGLLFIVPLADMFKRKRLMVIDFGLVIFSLLWVALAPNIAVLSIASYLVGLSSVIPQLLIPMAAHMAAPHERGKKIGIVMSGLLLIGILLSRTLSGFVGMHFGWRTMFYVAAGLMVIVWLLIIMMLPEIEPHFKGTYGGLMRSLLDLIKHEPKLRLAAFRGALCFAAFSAFWSTIVFLLKENFNLGSDVAGEFGLVGAFGAIAAGLMGRLSDKMDAFKLTAVTLLLVLASFIVFYFSGHSIIGLIIGVILLDMGVQATHISNQAVIFALNPSARNRLNTVYMVSYFIGGAAGTFAATELWSSYKWAGVCMIGMATSVIVLIMHLLNRKKMQNS